MHLCLPFRNLGESLLCVEGGERQCWLPWSEMRLHETGACVRSVRDFTCRASLLSRVHDQRHCMKAMVGHQYLEHLGGPGPLPCGSTGAVLSPLAWGQRLQHVCPATCGTSILAKQRPHCMGWTCLRLACNVGLDAVSWFPCNGLHGNQTMRT